MGFQNNLQENSGLLFFERHGVSEDINLKYYFHKRIKSNNMLKRIAIV